MLANLHLHDQNVLNLQPPPSKKRKGPPVPSSSRSSGGAPFNVDDLSAPSNKDVDGFKRIISTHMNDLTEPMKEQLQEHASRTKAEMYRSDYLQRILFAVQDAHNVIVASIDKNFCHASAAKRCFGLETKRLC